MTHTLVSLNTNKQTYYRAQCSCLWKGFETRSSDAAQRNFEQHKREQPVPYCIARFASKQDDTNAMTFKGALFAMLAVSMFTQNPCNCDDCAFLLATLHLALTNP